MKSKKSLTIILSVFTVLFNICAFLIPSTFTINFWLSYIFSMISIIFQIIIFANKNFEDKILKKYFFGYTFISIDIAYIVLQMILFIICKFVDIHIWLTIVLNVMLLGIIIIVFCSIMMSFNFIDELDSNNLKKKHFIKKIQIEIELMIEQEKDNETRDKLIKLSEKVKFSDPVSSNELRSLENTMIEKVELLKKSKYKNKIIEELNILLNERNKKCALYKGEI